MMLTKPTPDLFNRIKLGWIGWQLDNTDIANVLHQWGLMPARTIHNYNGMPTGFCFSRYLLEMACHYALINIRGYQCLGFSCARAHCAKQIRIVKLLLLHRSGPSAFLGPKPCGGILLTYSRFILKPEIHLIQRNMASDQLDRFNFQFF